MASVRRSERVSVLLLADFGFLAFRRRMASRFRDENHVDAPQCCRSYLVSSQASDSQTHASLANHSWIVSQSGQTVCPKNTGLERNAAASTCKPVEIARPLSGQRIIRKPIRMHSSLCYDRYRPCEAERYKAPMAIRGFSRGLTITDNLPAYGVESRPTTPHIGSRKSRLEPLERWPSDKF
jgi:hypothetical protein